MWKGLIKWFNWYGFYIDIWDYRLCGVIRCFNICNE